MIAVICKDHKQFEDWCNEKDSSLYDCVIREKDLVGKAFSDYIVLNHNYDLEENIKCRIEVPNGERT